MLQRIIWCARTLCAVPIVCFCSSYSFAQDRPFMESVFDAPEPGSCEVLLPDPAYVEEMLVDIDSIGSDAGETYQRRVALVVGNGDYSNAPLKNPVNDAVAMTRVLRGIGFTVYQGTDLDALNLKGCIDSYIDELSHERADISLIFYAGHGIRVLPSQDTEKRNYMMSTDASVGGDGVIVGLHQIEAVLAEARRYSDQSIFFFDACRTEPVSDLISASINGRPLTRQALLTGMSGAVLSAAPIEEQTDKYIAFATHPNMWADDSYEIESNHSPFTLALLNNIAAPGYSIDDVLTNVTTDVVQLTGGSQVPKQEGTLTQDVKLNGELTRNDVTSLISRTLMEVAALKRKEIEPHDQFERVDTIDYWMVDFSPTVFDPRNRKPIVMLLLQLLGIENTTLVDRSVLRAELNAAISSRNVADANREKMLNHQNFTEVWFSLDDQKLFTISSGDRGLEHWSSETGEWIETVEKGTPDRGTALRSSGDKFLINGNVRSNDGEFIRTINDVQSEIIIDHIYHDTNTLYYIAQTGTEGLIKKLHLESGSQTSLTSIQATTPSLFVDPKTNQLLVATNRDFDDELLSISLSKDNTKKKIALPENTRSGGVLDFYDGTVAIGGSQLQIFELDNGVLEFSGVLEGSCDWRCWLSLKHRIFVLERESEEFEIFVFDENRNVESQKKVQFQNCETYPTCPMAISLSATGKKLAIGYGRDFVILDLNNNSVVKSARPIFDGLALTHRGCGQKEYHSDGENRLALLPNVCELSRSEGAYTIGQVHELPLQLSNELSRIEIGGTSERWELLASENRFGANRTVVAKGERIWSAPTIDTTGSSISVTNFAPNEDGLRTTDFSAAGSILFFEISDTGDRALSIAPNSEMGGELVVEQYQADHAAIESILLNSDISIKAATAFNNSRRWVAFAEEGGSAIIFDFSDQRPIFLDMGVNLNPFDVKLTVDDSELVVLSNGVIHKFTIKENEIEHINRVAIPGGEDLVLSRFGNYAAHIRRAGARDDNPPPDRVEVFDTSTGRKVFTINAGHDIYEFWFSDDERHLFFETKDDAGTYLWGKQPLYGQSLNFQEFLALLSSRDDRLEVRRKKIRYFELSESIR
ncbi:MAG: caspase family protein [Henriciella sp.]